LIFSVAHPAPTPFGLAGAHGMIYLIGRNFGREGSRPSEVKSD
jgi:hypothetical protein